MKTSLTGLSALLALPLSFACAADTDAAAQELSEPPQMGQAPAGAEQEPTPEEIARFRLERMREHLDLTDAQVEQLRPILERGHVRHRQAREETRAEIAEVLTPEQMARLEQHLERRRHGRHGPHGRFGRGDPMERVRAHLELTDEQVAQVEPILRDAHERGRELRDLPAEERRAAAEALHADVRAQLSPILTEEQLTKLDQVMERRLRRAEHRWQRRGPGRRGPAPAPDGIDPRGI